MSLVTASTVCHLESEVAFLLSVVLRRARTQRVVWYACRRPLRTSFQTSNRWSLLKTEAECRHAMVSDCRGSEHVLYRTQRADQKLYSLIAMIG